MTQLNSHKHSLPPPANSRVPIIHHLTFAYALWQEQAQHFPKKSRYTLGSKIDQVFVETLEYTFIASMMPRKKKKLAYIERAVIKFDLLKFFLRVAWETKALDTKKYTALSEPLGTIGKMLGGWRKNVLSQQTPSK